MKNILKDRIRKGEVIFGCFCGLAHPDVTERLSRYGLDYIILDGEHSPMSYETMRVLMQAMNGSSCTPLVRPPWNDMVTIKRVLDIGAYGLIIPWVSSKEEAESSVQACKYPPEGLRGCSPRRAGHFDLDYVRTANDEILIVVQIETARAVENIDEILAVKGIDGIFVGPEDLGLSLGFHGQAWGEARYMEAMSTIVAAFKKAGKPAGIAARPDIMKWVLENGFTFPTALNADGYLRRGCLETLKECRDILTSIEAKH